MWKVILCLQILPHNSLISTEIKMSLVKNVDSYMIFTKKKHNYWEHISCCHIEFNINHIFCENYVLVKFYQGTTFISIAKGKKVKLFLC
jgi:hypothetical protein